MLKTNYLTNNIAIIMGTIIPKTIRSNFCKSCMVLILSFIVEIILTGLRVL